MVVAVVVVGVKIEGDVVVSAEDIVVDCVLVVSV